MPTFDGKMYATDRELVEAVAATLGLPRGLFSDDDLARWSGGLGARGWQVAEASDTHYLLEHPSSGFTADLRLLRYDPVAPDSPVLDPAAEPQPEALRPAFSTVRLAAPADHGLLADANLTSVGPDGAVTWLIAHTEPVGPSGGSTSGTGTATTATASPFEGGRTGAALSAAKGLAGIARRAVSGGTRDEGGHGASGGASSPSGGGAARRRGGRRFLPVLLFNILCAVIALVVLRRSGRRRASRR